MAEEAPNSVVVLMGTTSLLSLAALFYLFQKHIDGRPLIAYQPRRSVPWGAGVGLFAIAMPLFGVVVFMLSLSSPPPEVEPVSTESQLAFGWGNLTFMMLFVLGVGAWIAAFYHADEHDFGLPTSLPEALQDIGIGCLATLASFVPIYLVQLTLVVSLDIKTKHPLVEQVEGDQSISMMVLAVAMAVIAAPLFEEFTFRCLFQGWLEKCEDQATGFAATRREPPVDELLDGGYDNLDESELPLPEGAVHADLLASQIDETEDPTDEETPPTSGWIPALPHGWTPILISGVAFGLAHVGHGVAPISLILFGIVLGYLYQRTHRLLPCIAAHMLFNAYSMGLLWMQLKPPE